MRAGSLPLTVFLGFVIALGVCVFAFGVYVVSNPPPTYRCVVFDDRAVPDLGHVYTCTILHPALASHRFVSGEGK